MSQCDSCIHTCRPLINHKVEDKVCGEGPDLEAIFEADSHLQGLCQNIQVSIVYKTQYLTIYTIMHVHVRLLLVA